MSIRVAVPAARVGQIGYDPITGFNWEGVAFDKPHDISLHRFTKDYRTTRAKPYCVNGRWFKTLSNAIRYWQTLPR